MGRTSGHLLFALALTAIMAPSAAPAETPHRSPRTVGSTEEASLALWPVWFCASSSEGTISGRKTTQIAHVTRRRATTVRAGTAWPRTSRAMNAAHSGLRPKKSSARAAFVSTNARLSEMESQTWHSPPTTMCRQPEVLVRLSRCSSLNTPPECRTLKPDISGTVSKYFQKIDCRFWSTVLPPSSCISRTSSESGVMAITPKSMISMPRSRSRMLSVRPGCACPRRARPHRARAAGARSSQARADHSAWRPEAPSWRKCGRVQVAVRFAKW